jgi:hypothetical protein
MAVPNYTSCSVQNSTPVHRHVGNSMVNRYTLSPFLLLELIHMPLPETLCLGQR